MTENVENLVLEQLRYIRAAVDDIRADVKEVKHRLGNVESSVVAARRDALGTQEDVYRQQAALDRISDRIARIETRLDLS